MGIEVERERHGFDYDNEHAVAEQMAEIKKDILALKDHPALLMWGIGNELNLRHENPKVWDAVNDLSKMIHQIDPNHLTTTMLAGAEPEVITQVAENCPDLDLLSFQIYGAIDKLPNYLQESNYQGAYMITEWGATGHWECENTTWDRPIEANSSKKPMTTILGILILLLQMSNNALDRLSFYGGKSKRGLHLVWVIFRE